MFLYQIFILVVLIICIPISFFSITVRRRVFPTLPNNRSDIYIHGTSLGEIVLILELLNKIKAKTKIHITTSTQKSFNYLKSGVNNRNNITIGYIPLDTYFHMYFFLHRLKVKKLYIIEHDTWPNMLKIAKKLKIKRYLLNANFKKQDYLNYKKYSFVVPLFFNFDYIYVQNKMVEEQFRSIGIDDSFCRIQNIGNLKYIYNTESREQIKKLKIKKKIEEKIITLGSFHRGEEKLWQDNVKYNKKAKWIIIPRHLDVMDEWFESFSFYGKVVRYSQYIPDENFDILLVDVWGYSKEFYKISDVVVIGDSFMETEGGHNVYEPLLFKKPVIYGKYLKTFSDITTLFESKGIFFREDIKDINKRFNRLLYDDLEYSKIEKQITIELKKLKIDNDIIDRIFKI